MVRGAETTLTTLQTQDGCYYLGFAHEGELEPRRRVLGTAG